MATSAEKVAELLMAGGYSLAVAESCTGGLLGATLTDVPGSSRWFVGGVIAYSNELKTKLLGVDTETLKEHGAVSEPTARAMAEGVQSLTGADIAVAITGIAGPTGGTPQKPVGTVFVAIRAGSTQTVVERLSLSGSRRAIREKTVLRALELIARATTK